MLAAEAFTFFIVCQNSHSKNTIIFSVLYVIDKASDDAINRYIRKNPEEPVTSGRRKCRKRQTEEDACKKIVTEHPDERIIVATGGGICDNAPALNILRDLGKFVFLRLDIQYSVMRIMAKIKTSPFGGFDGAPAWVTAENPKSINDVKDIILARFTARNEQYKNIADIIVDIKNAPKEENFKSILGAI